MPTVFGEEERSFYNTLFISDPKKRRKSLDEWMQKTIPKIQASVATELEQLLDGITKDTWIDEGWKQREQKWRTIENEYHLVMEIKLRRVHGEQYQGTLPEPITRFRIGSNVKHEEKIPVPIMSKLELDLHGMNVHEAQVHIEDFLQDCHKTGEKVVFIIHGKGQGILKDITQKTLKNHPLVESFSIADKSHGAEGALQVKLKT